MRGGDFCWRLLSAGAWLGVADFHREIRASLYKHAELVGASPRACGSGRRITRDKMHAFSFDASSPVDVTP